MAITVNPQETIDALSYGLTARIYSSTSGGTVFSANQTANSAFDYFANNAVANDALYIGMNPTRGATLYWHNPIFYVGTPLVADAITVAYEYYKDTGVWTAIPNVIDTTNVFRTAGVGGIYFEMPDDARAVSINSNVNYYIRIRIVSVTNISEGGANSTNKVKLNTGRIQITQNAGIADLYTSEKATPFLLLPALPSGTYTPYAQPRPLDWGATKLTVVVTNYSVSGSVAITGTDENGTAVTETLTVTGNGTQTTTKNFKTINSNGIVITGTFNTQISQPRAGMVAQYTGNTFAFYKVHIINGDGVTAFTFTFLTEFFQLRQTMSLIWNTVNSIMNFGALSGGFLGKGGAILLEPKYATTSTFDYVIYGDGAINFYNMNVDNILYSRVFLVAGVVQGCKFAGIYDLILQTNAVVVSDTSVNFTSVWSFAIYGVNTTLTDVKSESAVRGVLLFNSGGTLIRPKSIGCTADITLHRTAGMSVTIIDPQFTITPSKISCYSATGDTFILYQKHTFDCNVSDGTDPISGASVVLKDKDGTQIFSLSTDASGDIAQQTVLYREYKYVLGAGLSAAYRVMDDSMIIEKSPFTITVTKAGYETVIKKIKIKSKTSLEDALKIEISKLEDDNGNVFDRVDKTNSGTTNLRRKLTKVM